MDGILFNLSRDLDLDQLPQFTNTNNELMKAINNLDERLEQWEFTGPLKMHNIASQEASTTLFCANKIGELQTERDRRLPARYTNDLEGQLESIGILVFGLKQSMLQN